MKPKLIIVWWVDACNGAGWEKLSRIKAEKLPVCCNAGFVVEDDEEKIILTNGFNDDEGIGFMAIPKGMVVKKKFVKY